LRHIGEIKIRIKRVLRGIKGEGEACLFKFILNLTLKYLILYKKARQMTASIIFSAIIFLLFIAWVVKTIRSFGKNKADNTIIKKEKSIFQKPAYIFVIILVTAIVVGTVISNYTPKTKYESSDNAVKVREIVFNDEWDGSVSQVREYLKATLNDWDSYQSMEWSPVTKITTAKAKYAYVVRHKYRAANAFGARIIKEQMFYCDKEGVIKKITD
jgi:hypothetical protein